MSRRRLFVPLAARIFLLSAILVALVAGAAILVTYQQGQRIAARESAQALDTSIVVQREFEQRRLEQLQFMIQQLAADANFVAYVADARRLALGLDDEDPTRGALSVYDLLSERRASHGFDIGMVLDDQAVLLARSDQAEFFAEDLRDDPLVGSAWEELHPFAGYWRLDDRLYQAAIMPLQQDQDLVGFLLLALVVDDAFCRRIAGVSGAEIAYGLPDGQRLRIIASSLPAATAQAFADRLPEPGNISNSGADDGRPVSRLQLELDDQVWLAQLGAVADASSPELGAILSLASTAQAAAGYRRILNLMLLTGVVALALALALSYLLSKGILRPVRRLAEATESAAAGNYRADVALAGRDELARLSRAVDALLASLREKSDIEHYLGSLSRALPEPGAGDGAIDTADPQPPRHQRLVFVAMRKPADADADADAEGWPPDTHTDDAIAAELDERRLLLAFDDAATALRSLARLRNTGAGGAGMAWALHLGEADLVELRVAGRIQTRLTNAPTELIERMLDEVPTDAIVLGPAIAETCRDLLGGRPTIVLKGVHGRPLLALDPRALNQLSAHSRAGALTSQQNATPGPLPGRVLGHRYQVLSMLGSGGMGAVYKVRDVDLDEIVALKMLRPGVLLDSTQLERLKDELRLARKITHANVVRTFDYIEIDGRPCISMEYVRGMTLRFLLESSGRIPLSAGLRIARQITAGLVAAHEVGVLHRDLKPENVILEASGNAKLMDFGIARPMQRNGPGQTEIGTFVGTPQYCAPEQLAGEPIGAAADLYALGAVMCEMFGGQLPHAGTNTMELYVAKAQQAPTPPSAHGVELPDGLEAIILSCLDRIPGRRPGSAKILLDLLTQVRA